MVPSAPQISIASVHARMAAPPAIALQMLASFALGCPLVGRSHAARHVRHACAAFEADARRAPEPLGDGCRVARDRAGEDVVLLHEGDGVVVRRAPDSGRHGGDERPRIVSKVFIAVMKPSFVW